MAVSAALVAVAAVTAYSSYQSHEDAKIARRQTEELAAKQRQSLASLQAEPTPVVPVADDTAKAARRRSISEQMRRRGRSSTILTGNGPSDALGA